MTPVGVAPRWQPTAGRSRPDRPPCRRRTRVFRPRLGPRPRTPPRPRPCPSSRRGQWDGSRQRGRTSPVRRVTRNGRSGRARVRRGRPPRRRETWFPVCRRGFSTFRISRPAVQPRSAPLSHAQPRRCPTPPAPTPPEGAIAATCTRANPSDICLLSRSRAPQSNSPAASAFRTSCLAILLVASSTIFPSTWTAPRPSAWASS